MKAPAKIWWHGEPLIVGGLRWQITENDLLQKMKAALAEYRRQWTIAGMKRVSQLVCLKRVRKKARE